MWPRRVHPPFGLVDENLTASSAKEAKHRHNANQFLLPVNAHFPERRFQVGSNGVLLNSQLAGYQGEFVAIRQMGCHSNFGRA